MKIQVVAALADDESRLCALFELYMYDFSEIVPLDVDDAGRFRVPPLAACWADARCHPFLIRCDEQLAGFALVQEGSRLTGEASVYDVAEFFVMRRYRRLGVGQHVAGWLFDQFPGKWEVRQRATNPAATAFWRRVIGRLTGDRYEELVLDDERWRGPVQRFTSSRTS